MPLPFTVVTARGPDGLPRLPRLRIARQRKKRKSKTSACGALAFFFRLAPAALPRTQTLDNCFANLFGMVGNNLELDSFTVAAKDFIADRACEERE